LFSGPAREFLDRRGELVVEAEEATQLDLVARIASAAGYTVTPVNDSLRIACPLDWASELNQRAREAGATHIVIRAMEASLEHRRGMVPGNSAQPAGARVGPTAPACGQDVRPLALRGHLPYTDPAHQCRSHHCCSSVSGDLDGGLDLV